MSQNDLFSNPNEMIKYFIHQTPIGLLDSCIKNLNVLLREKLKTEVTTVPETIKEIKIYKEDHLMPITVKNAKSKVIISSFNKDSDGFYYDQTQKIRFKLNDKCEVEKVEEFESKNETRMKIAKKFVEYFNKYYNKNFTYYNIYYDSLVDKVHILICGQNINEKNFYSGEWLSIWELDIGEKKVTGQIKINSIYYEDGNVNFNFAKNYETTINGSDDDSIANELVGFIEKTENEIQEKLEEVNGDNSEVYINQLRNRVPLIGCDMKWSLDQIQFNQNQNK
jgi:capping protein alpha